MFKCQLPNESLSSFPSLVCFLLANTVSMDTAFFKNNKYPPGIHEVKVNLLLMKQEADSFSFTTTYQKNPKQNPASKQSVHTSVSIHHINHTWAAGWNYHQAGMNLLFAGCRADLCSPDVLSHWLSFLQANQAIETHIRHRSLQQKHIHFDLIATFLGRLSRLMASTSKAGASTASVIADKVVQAAWFCQV